MDLTQIVNILQIGFSGFAFLLAGMSYKLLSGESARSSSARPEILGSIAQYTKYTMLLAVLVLTGQLIDRSLDFYFQYQTALQKQLQATKSNEARNCSGSLSRLLYAETRINNTYDSLLQAIQESKSNCHSTLELLSE